jgi:uroporphyrinogen-III synthase
MLQGRRIAVPESRELDLFAGMLERQGAIAIRCPLVSIHDVEDPASVQAWLERLAGGQQDSLVLYTGEGLARLLGFARRGGIEAEVIAGLRRTRKIVRGPKPAKVLRSIGLSPDVTAEEPTTAGLIATLSALDLRGSRVGVQLYPGGEDLLTGFLIEAGAEADPILCYRYASDEEDEQVVHLIDELKRFWDHCRA